MSTPQRLAILVGGGPAPGINSVIASATIRAILEGVEVLGVRDGFEWLMKGDLSHVVPLTLEDATRIHWRGGSDIGIARANPTKDPKLLETVIASLLQLGVSRLITIGGDDTAYSAMRLQDTAAGRLQIVHVPKTIDNDLDLPSYVDTFGYQTARHYGAEIVKNLMVDARTTSRWYFAIAMGRSAGHLALGIGKASGATLTMIPEEFPPGRISLEAIVDTLACAVVKRLSEGHKDGVAVIAEGLVLGLDAETVARLSKGATDAHGHVRLAEVDIGELLKPAVRARLKGLGIETTIATKDIGYELRCADPIPFDLDYTRDLGYCAAKYLLSGGSAAMISLQAGNFVPVPFEQMLDPKTGRAKVRKVDVTSTRYAIARRYMTRLRRDDFEEPGRLAKIAASAGMSVDAFRKEFEYLVEAEQPPLVLPASS
jgi:6-phosphofructokinase